MQGQPDGRRGVFGVSYDKTNPSKGGFKIVSRDMQVVGVGGGNQSFNFWELSSEKSCRDANIDEVEHRVKIAVAEHDCPVIVGFATPGQPLDLRKCLCGDKDLTTWLHDRHSSKIAERETIGVCRDKPETAFGRDH